MDKKITNVSFHVREMYVHFKRLWGTFVLFLTSSYNWTISGNTHLTVTVIIKIVNVLSYEKHKT
jgi:hypothetical protein